MRIVVSVENKKIAVPVPNALIALLGLRSKSCQLSGGQCRRLIKELKRCKPLMGDEPLVEFESSDGKTKVVVRL